MIRVERLTEDNLDDVFRVCSHGKLEDTLQIRGINLKRQWLLETLKKGEHYTKLAYLDEKPIAQILFYPENANPTVSDPREGVIILHCVYNPFPEARGKGAGSMLLRSLIDDCSRGARCLKAKKCSFIAAQAFNTGEGVSLNEFYSSHGFKEGIEEMYMEIHGQYKPRRIRAYRPLPEDKGRAVMFYDPVCEWGIGFAFRVKEFLKGIDPDLPVNLINCWEKPGEYIRRGGQHLVVNATPITSFWTDKEALTKEVKNILKKL